MINGGTVIGNNCNVSQFLSIGTNKRTPATIGDNVYIGPNVCIVEDVNIGNNVTIGAGAVVTKDIPDNATAAGVPARVLNYDNPGIYVARRYKNYCGSSDRFVSADIPDAEGKHRQKFDRID